MAKIRYIEDKDGGIVLPLTHERAVVDSDGVTLETKLGMKQDTAKSVTHSELVALRDEGKLIPGTMYRVTDYVATVRDNALYSEARSANHPFDIIVTAIDESHLSEECLAAPHEGDTYFAAQNLFAWRIWYTIDNDTATYDWADPVNGKGVIYRMIDENANDIGYDFKGILFARYPIHPLEGYEGALSNIDGWYLGCKYSNDAAPAGISVDTTAEAQWFYTFSHLTDGWDDPTDASLRKGVSAVYNVTIPSIMRTNARFLSNNVFINGAFAQGKFTEFGWTQMSTTHAMHIDAMGDTSQNTFFGYAGSIQSMSQMRHNICVGDFRHNRIATDFEGNIIVAGDISFNDLWMGTTVIRARSFFHNNGGGLSSDSVLRATGAISYNTFSARFNDNRITAGGEIAGNVFAANFHDNTVNATGDIDNNDFGDSFYSNTITVTGAFQGNTINGYCYGNSVTCGNFTHNELSYFSGNTISTTQGVNSNVFGPYFEGNTLAGRLTSNRFASGQTRYCSLTDIVGCTFGGILEYMTVPSVSGKRFTHCDVKGGLRGTASVPLTLDNDAFFLASAAGVTRRVTIEGSTGGKIVATWMDGDAPKGVIKTQGGEWTDIGLVTEGSIINLLEALKAAGKINTYTMIWDSSDGKWEFSFT